MALGWTVVSEALLHSPSLKAHAHCCLMTASRSLALIRSWRHSTVVLIFLAASVARTNRRSVFETDSCQKQCRPLPNVFICTTYHVEKDFDLRARIIGYYQSDIGQHAAEVSGWVGSASDVGKDMIRVPWQSPSMCIGRKTLGRQPCGTTDF